MNEKIAEYENKIGILILADIVDFTTQAHQLGDARIPQPLERIETTIKKISPRPDVHFIKSIGDAFLVFIEGIDSHRIRCFLDIVSELRDKSLAGYFDVDDFIISLRFVALPGEFQFKMKNKQISDLISAAGIKAFRLEKEADRYEVIITAELLKLMKNTLKENKIKQIPLGEILLKGFTDEPTFIYKLQFPGKTEPSELLEMKMAELEKECQTIPLFGGVFPAVSMEKNFINLSIKGRQKDPYLDVEKKARVMETLETYERAKKDESITEHFDLLLNAGKLYETSKQGVIFGLPGSGKTTILRYFAYRDFRRMTPGSENKRVILIFYCRTCLPYEKWLKSSQKKQAIDLEDIEAILYYFTHHFLFGKKTNLAEKEKKEQYKAKKEVIEAYQAGRLTLLLDGLDESESRKMKENIVSLYRQLADDFINGNNKIYLTSRPSDKESFFDREEDPAFEVCSLDMEQLRQMARYFYTGEPGLYQKFDEAVWKDQIVARIGGTPLTAALLLAYFKIFLRLESRYKMYDVLILFILLKIWKQVKETDVRGGLIKKFFEDAAGIGQSNPELSALYDALTILSYDYSQVEESTMTRTSILDTFNRIAKNEEKAGAWFDDLVREHLLLRVGRSKADEEYIFIHSTIMEYLAARFIVNCLENRDFDYLKESVKNERPLEKVFNKMDWFFFDRETIPIASGSSMGNGFKIMGLLHKSILSQPDEEIKQMVYVCAYKSLAELEREIDNQMEKARLSDLKCRLKEQSVQHRDNMEWVYRWLKEYVLGRSEDPLKKNLHMFANISKLCRPDFLEDYLTFPDYADGDAAIVSLRKELLSSVVDANLLNDWLLRNKNVETDLLLKKEETQLKKAGGSLLRFDSLDYNPEDKNFNYYEEYTGHFLAGILGSPNLRHSGPVNCIALLTDEEYIVSGSDDKTLKLWKLSTGKETRIFKGHEKPVTAVSVFPDGKYMVSGSKDCTLKLWEIATGKEIRVFKGHKAAVTGVIALPDGDFIISSSDDETLKLWDIATGEEIRTFKGHSHYINCIAVVPGNKYLVSGSSDRTLKVWEIFSGREIQCFRGHDDYVTCASVAPDGKSIISGSADGILKLWELSTGKEILGFKGHEDVVTAVSILPDGKHAISASFDNTLKLWNLSSGKKIGTFKGHRGPVNCAAATPGGEYIISGSGDFSLKVWSSSTGIETLTFKDNMADANCAAISPDGKYIVTGSHEHALILGDLSTGKETRLFKGHTHHVSCAAVSPDGKYLLSGSYDHTLKSWELSSGKEIRSFKGHTDHITCLLISPDGEQLISGSTDHTMKLWNMATGEEVREFRGHHAAVNAIAVTPDEKQIISASSDKTLKLWRLSHGEEIYTFKGHSSYVTCVSVIVAEKLFISGSSDGTLRLWNLNGGDAVRSFLGHSDGVACLWVTPGGKYLISGSYDMTFKVWDIQRGTCIRTVDLPWVPLRMEPIPGKSSQIITSNRDGNISLFNFSELMK